MPDAARTPEFSDYVDGVVLGLRCFDPGKAGSTLGPRALSDAELGGIRVPVLYMAGQREKLSSVPAAVKRLNAVAPRIQLAVVPGAGHDLIEVQPEVVSQKVVEFLTA
jgi:pimeloyl-ACP methyl ester carboxylesterase